MRGLLITLVAAALLTSPEPYVRTHLEGLCAAAGKAVPEAAPEAVDKVVAAAVENLSKTYIGEGWKGPHPPGLNRGIGSYTAACVWYELSFGETPGPAYVPLHMEKDSVRLAIARLCAHAACEDPSKVTDVGYGHIKVRFKDLPPYTLPDPLRTVSGRKIRNSRQWTSRRREELLELFETRMFGRAPGRPEGEHFEPLYRDGSALGKKAVRKEVKVHFDNTGEHYLRLLIYLPADATGPVPVFLGINFLGNWGVTAEEGIIYPNKEEILRYGRLENPNRGCDTGRWPLDMILEAGFGIATFYRGDIDPDFDDCFENGVQPLFYRSGQDYPDPDEWGTIAAWAWGLRRAMDYLETDPEIDPSRVAVFGHSRLGKTALWAGAQDERFAMVISNCSGNCGAALSRRRYGETIRKVNEYRPQWFCDNFLEYNDNEDALPFDQHELIALCAPRPVYVASGETDRNADPLGEFLALKAASPVYRLFGLKGLEDKDFPPVATPVGEGPLGYHLHPGGHGITPYDWEQYISFAREWFLKNRL